jgi:voltage-gated potassium channel
MTERWEKAVDWPLTISALIFLAAYAVPIINPDVPPGLEQLCRIAVWLTWVLFGVDFVIRVTLADQRGRYIRQHWLDVLILALPLLRSLALLRLASLVMVLNRHALTGLRGRVAIYVAGGSTLLAFCGALAVLDVERGHPEATIATFGDAVWWAVTTMTTVGYGDLYPVTGRGRFAAAALMVAGVALIGTVTATLASWLLERMSAVEEREASDLRAEVKELRLTIGKLSAITLERLPARPEH